ncbi:helix-turn-helix domain-containing protein [Paenibacillus sp. EZ-K15]|uniref:helix-turn-helix domain-containing protein n=1 Tax=Paenibacillus sp. EZ-K15 TaxID=2044275 RepID=UPI000BF9B690|nr:helix-turn-helix domain-containing protein [Paenibacillus sp. EZ-K15]
MNRNWFTRMLMLYIPVFLIVPAFLFFVFSQSLSESNRKDAERSNAFVTQQAMLMIDTSLSSLDQKISLEMLRNRKVISFFSRSTEKDLPLQVDVMNLLRDLKMTNPLIHSIYMVQADHNQVLNESTSYPLDQYADNAFIRSKLETPNSHWSDIRSYKELPSDKGVPVVSLTRSVSIFSKHHGLIVVNVSADALQGMLLQMHDPSSRILSLYDTQGNSLFDMAKSKTSVSKPVTNNGALQSEANSEYTGWRIVSSVQGADTFNFIISLSNIWFIAGLLLCAVSVAWIVYVTLQNYRPIQRLVNQLQQLSSKDDVPEEIHKNEFTFINSKLQNMIDQNKRFQFQFEEDLKAQQNFFMYELLEGTRSFDLKEWEKEAAKHGLPVLFGKPLVFVLEIDHRSEWSANYGQKQHGSQQKAIETIILKAASDHACEVKLLWVSLHQLACILVISPQAEKQGFEALSFTEECQCRFADALSFTVSVGIGEPVEHPDNLHDSYHEALDALQTKPVNRSAMIIPYSSDALSKDHSFHYFQQVDRIVDAFQLQEVKWKTQMQALFQNMLKEGISRRGASSVLHYLTYHLNKTASSMNDEYYLLWKTETMPALDRVQKEIDLPEDWTQMVLQLLEQFAQRLDKQRNLRSQGNLVQEVKAYIEKHYTKAELSLDYLQDKFGISGKYLSRLFKEEYGLKFVDFLIDLRIQEAKRLLTESALSVQEITERVGYSSPISFARTFKKITGVPPMDYRKGK